MGMNRGAKIVSDGLIFCVDAASKRSYDGGDHLMILVPLAQPKREN